MLILIFSMLPFCNHFQKYVTCEKNAVAGLFYYQKPYKYTERKM